MSHMLGLQEQTADPWFPKWVYQLSKIASTDSNFKAFLNACSLTSLSSNSEEATKPLRPFETVFDLNPAALQFRLLALMSFTNRSPLWHGYSCSTATGVGSSEISCNDLWHEDELLVSITLHHPVPDIIQQTVFQFRICFTGFQPTGWCLKIQALGERWLLVATTFPTNVILFLTQHLALSAGVLNPEEADYSQREGVLSKSLLKWLRHAPCVKSMCSEWA